MQATCDRLRSELDQVRKQNKDLLHERIRLETELLRIRDELTRMSGKLVEADEEGATLQKFAFSLADATCQHFNPKNVRAELERLLEVVRAEHSELHETARVRLDPFRSLAAAPRGTARPSYFSKFDELDREIASLQLSRSGK